jgi:hypothetical protein
MTWHGRAEKPSFFPSPEMLPLNAKYARSLSCAKLNDIHRTIDRFIFDSPKLIYAIDPYDPCKPTINV